MSALYVYALSGRRTAPFAVQGHQIEFVKFGTVHAAVERPAERPAVSEAALRTQHDIVIRISASVDDVLPVRFGAFVEEEELGQLIAMRREVIERALELVRGRVQMTARLRGQEASDARPAVSPAIAVASGTAYLEARRSAAARPLTPMAMSVAGAVRHLAVSETIDSEAARTSIALYHLIDKRHVQEYKDALFSLHSDVLTVTGPWPPFAFAPDLWP
jgi:hypothetical protein